MKNIRNVDVCKKSWITRTANSLPRNSISISAPSTEPLSLRSCLDYSVIACTTINKVAYPTSRIELFLEDDEEPIVDERSSSKK